MGKGRFLAVPTLNAGELRKQSMEELLKALEAVSLVLSEKVIANEASLTAAVGPSFAANEASLIAIAKAGEPSLAAKVIARGSPLTAGESAQFNSQIKRLRSALAEYVQTNGDELQDADNFLLSELVRHPNKCTEDNLKRINAIKRFDKKFLNEQDSLSKTMSVTLTKMSGAMERVKLFGPDVVLEGKINELMRDVQASFDHNKMTYLIFALMQLGELLKGANPKFVEKIKGYRELFQEEPKKFKEFALLLKQVENQVRNLPGAVGESLMRGCDVAIVLLGKDRFNKALQDEKVDSLKSSFIHNELIRYDNIRQQLNQDIANIQKIAKKTTDRSVKKAALDTAQKLQEAANDFFKSPSKSWEVLHAFASMDSNPELMKNRAILQTASSSDYKFERSFVLKAQLLSFVTEFVSAVNESKIESAVLASIRLGNFLKAHYAGKDDESNIQILKNLVPNERAFCFVDETKRELALDFLGAMEAHKMPELKLASRGFETLMCYTRGVPLDSNTKFSRTVRGFISEDYLKNKDLYASWLEKVSAIRRTQRMFLFSEDMQVVNLLTKVGDDIVQAVDVYSKKLGKEKRWKEVIEIKEQIKDSEKILKDPIKFAHVQTYLKQLMNDLRAILNDPNPKPREFLTILAQMGEFLKKEFPKEVPMKLLSRLLEQQIDPKNRKDLEKLAMVDKIWESIPMDDLRANRQVRDSINLGLSVLKKLNGISDTNLRETKVEIPANFVKETRVFIREDLVPNTKVRKEFDEVIDEIRLKGQAITQSKPRHAGLEISTRFQEKMDTFFRNPNKTEKEYRAMVTALRDNLFSEEKKVLREHRAHRVLRAVRKCVVFLGNVTLVIPIAKIAKRLSKKTTNQFSLFAGTKTYGAVEKAEKIFGQKEGEIKFQKEGEKKSTRGSRQ